MNPQIIFIILALLSLALTYGLYALQKQIASLKEELKPKEDTTLLEWLKSMKTSMDKNTDTLERKLQEQQKSMSDELRAQRTALERQTKVLWERLENATNVIGKVKEQLGGINELGKDMKDLNNILKSPKLRGELGEQFLYEILEASLPKDLYRTQYRFSNGAICDAVIFIDKGIIPVDSKFSLENFRAMLTAETEKERQTLKKAFIRDVKKRIDEIAKKYILPEEGTTEQAVMYVPSENVFYEIITRSPDLEEYAREKNVLMTSPNTFSFFVKTILVAYRQHEIAKNAQEILKALSGIKIEAQRFGEDLGTLSKHITNAHKNMDKVTSAFGILFGKIESTQKLKDGNLNKLAGGALNQFETENPNGN